MKNKQAGSSLIEYAMVLAIMGLLAGGVIKGQELIDSAKVKGLMSDFNQIPNYLNGYQDKYRAIPGDDKSIWSTYPNLLNANACTPTGTASCTPGNGLLEGNWYDATEASETFVFWQHIRLAGFALGSTTITDVDYLPRNAVGGLMGIQTAYSDPTKAPINATTNANPIRATYVVCSASLRGKYAKQMDIAMDDGSPNSGQMMAGVATAVGVPMTAVTTFDDSATYTVCWGF